MPKSDRGLDYSFVGRPRERRGARLRRAVPSLVCLVGAVVLMAMIGDSDFDQGNLYAIPALALVWTAVTVPAWRSGRARDEFEGQALRLRRLHNRVHVRATVLLIDASIALLWAASYAHFEWSDEYDTTNLTTDSAHYDTYGGWCLFFFLAAFVPLLIVPLTWRLWPAPVRMAVREARMRARSAKRNAGIPFSR